MKNKKPKTTVFENAVKTTVQIKNCYKSGLKALERKHRIKIKLTDPNQCHGSVNIDGCLGSQNLYADKNRWDYVIGYNNEAYFVEVHTASTSDIKEVINKFEWLRNWLKDNAPELNKIKAKKKPYHWLQSSNFQIPVGEKLRKLGEIGLRPKPYLELK